MAVGFSILNSGDVTISSGQSLSNKFDLNTGMVVGIWIPANLTGASITFQVSRNGVDFYNLYDDVGTEISVVATNARTATIPLHWFSGASSMKIRSGTSGSPTSQSGGDAVVGITSRPFA